MNTTAFQLKAASFAFTIMQLSSLNLELIEAQVAAMTQKTPLFFNGTPVLLDLTIIEKIDIPLDINTLIERIRPYGLLPVGLKTQHATYTEMAKQLGLPIMNHTSSTSTEVKKKVEESHTSTLIIDQPVRSGKQIYAKGGDLIVTSSVSHGAEILADGNIHVYGNLYGRVLAGVQGNVAARIYANKSLDAELIAIAGNYLVNEQIPEQYKKLNQLLCVQLVDKTLTFSPIG